MGPNLGDSLMSLSTSQEADLDAAKSSNASSVVIICLFAMLVAFVMLNGLFLSAGGAAAPSEISSLIGP